MKPDAVPLDVAKQILELSKEGYGSNMISSITGINSSTVRRVIRGEHKGYSDKLSTRQIQEFIKSCFRPVEITF